MIEEVFGAIAMWSSAAAFTVSPWVAEVRPVAAAVIVGDPVTVSRYLKLPVEAPAAIEIEVMFAESAVLRKTPPEEFVVRFTVVVDVAFTTVPSEVCSWTVIVPELTPAVEVWELVENTILEGTFAITVSVAVSVLAELVAVTVWAPVALAVQLEVALVHEPFGVMANVEPVSVPRELLNTSKPVTVYVCDPPATIEDVFGAIATWSRAAAFTVSLCVVEVSPLAAAVIVGCAATVSPYRKLPLDDPAAIEIEVIVAVSAVLRKAPPVEFVVRFTVVAELRVPADPFDACSCTVIVPEVTPAVEVWELVVNPSLTAVAAKASGANETTRIVVKSISAVVIAIRRGKRVSTVEGLLGFR
jgi:hypothetical protein